MLYDIVTLWAVSLGSRPQFRISKDVRPNQQLWVWSIFTIFHLGTLQVACFPPKTVKNQVQRCSRGTQTKTYSIWLLLHTIYYCHCCYLYIYIYMCEYDTDIPCNTPVIKDDLISSPRYLWSFPFSVGKMRRQSRWHLEARSEQRWRIAMEVA